MNLTTEISKTPLSESHDSKSHFSATTLHLSCLFYIPLNHSSNVQPLKLRLNHQSTCKIG